MLPGGGGSSSTSTPSRTTRRKIQRHRNPPPPKPRTPARKPRRSYTPPRSSGGGGGGYSAPVVQRRIAKTATGHYTTPRPKAVRRPAAKKKPRVPTLSQFIGTDVAYQQQLRGFNKTLADYLADTTQQQGQLSSDYARSTRAVGEEKTKGLRSLMEDYGSRGLIHSGLYAKGVGDYENEVGQRLSDLLSGYNKAKTGLANQVTRFRGEQTLAKQEARSEAARRRAAKYKLKAK
jgi:hypothetical protein